MLSKPHSTFPVEHFHEVFRKKNVFDHSQTLREEVSVKSRKFFRATVKTAFKVSKGTIWGSYYFFCERFFCLLYKFSGKRSTFFQKSWFVRIAFYLSIFQSFLKLLDFKGNQSAFWQTFSDRVVETAWEQSQDKENFEKEHIFVIIFEHRAEKIWASVKSKTFRPDCQNRILPVNGNTLRKVYFWENSFAIVFRHSDKNFGRFITTEFHLFKGNFVFFSKKIKTHFWIFSKTFFGLKAGSLRIAVQVSRRIFREEKAFWNFIRIQIVFGQESKSFRPLSKFFGWLVNNALYAPTGRFWRRESFLFSPK